MSTASANTPGWRRLLAIAIATELVVFILTRLIILRWSAWHWLPELLRTGLRAGAALILWRCGREVIVTGQPRPQRAGQPLALAALALFVAVPLLIGNWSFMGPVTRSVFAATSLVVGLHEELLFRWIVQNVLARRWGVVRAVVLTSLLMTAWHLGALAPLAFNFLQVFLASCLLGLFYARTRSLALVVFLHALYDALWSLTPLWPGPLAWPWGVGLLVVAVGVTWCWWQRDEGERWDGWER